MHWTANVKDEAAMAWALRSGSSRRILPWTHGPMDLAHQLAGSPRTGILTVTCEGRPTQAMPCHAMPGHARPCQARPCQAMPGHARPCHARPCQAMPGHARPCQAMSGYVRPCQAMSGHARPCQAMPGHVRPCQAMPGLCHGRLVRPCQAGGRRSVVPPHLVSCGSHSEAVIVRPGPGQGRGQDQRPEARPS